MFHYRHNYHGSCSTRRNHPCPTILNKYQNEKQKQVKKAIAHKCIVFEEYIGYCMVVFIDKYMNVVLRKQQYYSRTDEKEYYVGQNYFIIIFKHEKLIKSVFC